MRFIPFFYVPHIWFYLNSLETTTLISSVTTPFSQKVMYHINPAVIKSIISSMPKEEFYRHARFIHSQSISLPDGSNRQVMFFNLWQWCLRLHRERFGG